MSIEITYFYIILLFLSFILDNSLCLISFLSCISHEIGHIISMYIFKVKIEKIKFLPFGFEIIPKNECHNIIGEFIINISGCLVNISFFILYNLGIFSLSNLYRTFAYSSLLLFILNILPIYGLDGGNALFSLLSLIFEYEKAFKISRTISFITLIILYLTSTYLILLYGMNLSLLFMTIWYFSELFLKKRKS